MVVKIEDLVFHEDGIAVLKTVDDCYTHNIFSSQSIMHVTNNIIDFSEKMIKQTNEVKALTDYIIHIYNEAIERIEKITEDELALVGLTKELLEVNNLDIGYNPSTKQLIVKKKQQIMKAR